MFVYQRQGIWRHISLQCSQLNIQHLCRKATLPFKYSPFVQNTVITFPKVQRHNAMVKNLARGAGMQRTQGTIFV